MFRSSKRSQSGQVLQGMLFGALSLVVVMVLVGIRTFRSQFTNTKLRDNIAQAQLSSGIETMVLAYRLAEMKYVDAVKDCDQAKPFLRALKEGSGCSMNVTVFYGDDLGTQSGLYAYSGPGCNITQNNSTCNQPNRRPILSIGNIQTDGVTEMPGDAATKKAREAYRINGVSYNMFLVAAEPAKQILQMLAVVTTVKGKSADGSTNYKSFNNEFAIRAAVPNMAHLELADGRVTQEKPNPIDKCKGQPWADFLVFNPNIKTGDPCQRFSQLGGGTGLAYNKEHYFGLRSMDGQIVDLISLGSDNASTYMVNEDGTIGGVSVLPPYSKELLTNTDDISVSGNQIQLVAGVGPGAQIGVIAPSDGGSIVRVNVCPLGQMGWSQSYSGITALNWNDPLYPPPTDPDDERLGIFLLKTDGGDLLEAVVRASAGSGYSCAVFKDSSQQAIEYKRSGGFDRTNDALPYYIY